MHFYVRHYSARLMFSCYPESDNKYVLLNQKQHVQHLRWTEIKGDNMHINKLIYDEKRHTHTHLAGWIINKVIEHNLKKI